MSNLKYKSSILLLPLLFPLFVFFSFLLIPFHLHLSLSPSRLYAIPPFVSLTTSWYTTSIIFLYLRSDLKPVLPLACLTGLPIHLLFLLPLFSSSVSFPIHILFHLLNPISLPPSLSTSNLFRIFYPLSHPKSQSTFSSST